MQLVTHPGFLVTLAVLLAAHVPPQRHRPVAGDPALHDRGVVEYLLQSHVGLPIELCRFQRRRRRALLRPATFANLLDWSGLDWSGLDWSGLDWSGCTRHAYRLFASFYLR